MAYVLKLGLLTHWEGRRPLALCFFCCWVFACTHAYGQFTSVINIPSDVAPAVLGSNTQLNLNEGGILRRGLEIGNVDGSSTNIEVNINGGQASGDLTVNAGGSLNFRKGFTGPSFSTIAANDGSRVSLSGGRIGSLLSVNEGSHVEIIGGDFRLNGKPIDDGTISLNQDFLRESRIPDFFTATLSDGTPLILASTPRIESLNLTEVALPDIDTTPSFVDANTGSVPIGLRPGQTLSVVEGGSLAEQFYAVESSVNVAGGQVGPNSRFAASAVDISSGTVSANSRYVAGSTVTLDGGTLFSPDFDNSHLVVNGGIFTGNVFASWQSTIVMNDGLFKATGNFANQIQLFDSSFTIHGGSAADVIANGGVIEIHGGEVRYANANRNPFAQLFDDVPPGSLIEMTSGVVRSSIRVGFQSELHLSGGTVGGPETGQQALSVSGGKAVVTGGVINGDVRVPSSSSVLNIHGGLINGNLVASAGSEVNLFVQDLSIDGEQLVIAPGAALQIADRDFSLLQATLADGSLFEIELNGAGPDSDFISPDALLTAWLVPEPTTAMLAVAFLGTFWLRRSSLRAATLLACIAIFASHSTAHAQFMTVINVPPDTAPQQVGSNTQVNVFAGGSLPDDFSAGGVDGSNANIEINLGLSSTSNGLSLFSSTAASISGGTHGDIIGYGANLTTTGGTTDDVSVSPSLVPLGAVSGLALLEGIVVGGEVSVASYGDIAVGKATLTGRHVTVQEGLFVNAAHALKQASAEFISSSINGSVRADAGGFISLANSSVNGDVAITDGSILELYSGTIAGELTISGMGLGSLQDTFASAEISGGAFEQLRLAGGEVTFFGTQFALGGVDITDGLTVGTPTGVDVADMTLTGLLQDGSPLSLDFTATGNDSISEGNPLPKLVLVEEFLPGDYNNDNLVDAADYAVWRDSLGTTGLEPFESADGNGDGDIDGDDYLLWQRNYGATLDDTAVVGDIGATVPEPTSAMLLVAASMMSLFGRRL